MTDERPTQPLTDAELAAIRTRFDNRNEDMRSWGPVTLFHAAREVPRLLAEVDRIRAELDTCRQWFDTLEAAAGYGNLTDVVNDLAERGLPSDHAARLRSKRVSSMVATVAEETAWRHQYFTDIESERDRLQEELEGWKDNAEDTLRMYAKLKTESVGTALGHLAKIERLQSERDALVRKLGLDWGPDEFGDLDAVPTGGGADRVEMLNDLQWYITDMGLEHWQNCDVGDEDCYLCAGHVAIRDRWKGVE